MTGNARMQNLQDRYLSELVKSGAIVSIHIINGFVVKNAVIVDFDSYAMLVAADEKQMLIYKHAISTITSQDNFKLK